MSCAWDGVLQMVGDGCDAVQPNDELDCAEDAHGYADYGFRACGAMGVRMCGSDYS